MAHEFTTSFMQLHGDYDTIEFVGTVSPNFKYIDNTLTIEQPEADVVRFSSLSYSGHAIKNVSYKTRTITLSLYIYGDTDNDVLNNVTRLQTLLSRTTSPFYLAGGEYDGGSAYSSFGFPNDDTGDSGLIFSFRLGKDGGAAITTETNASDDYTNNALQARVLRAELKNSNLMFSSAANMHVDGANKKVRQYDLTLECEPYLHMRARRLVQIDEPGLYDGLVSPNTSNINRIILAQGAVIGSEPAPTRIVTHLQGAYGMIVGRDVGTSMINAPSYPVFSGTGHNDMYVTGQYLNTTGKTWVVKIVATGPDKFAYSVNGGSFSASQTINPQTSYQLGSDNIYIFFDTDSNHNADDTWTFRSHQTVYQPGGSDFDIYTNRDAAYSENGVFVRSLYFNVPWQCRSRYKLIVTVSNLVGYTPEFASKIFYGGYADTVQKLWSGGAISDWVVSGNSSNWIDVGLLDFTANATPALSHPFSVGEVRIDLYTRSISTIANPATVNFGYAYLVPCPDENSWFQPLWSDDGDQYEHFCNYDMENPYMVESYHPEYGSYRRSMPLNGTFGGNFITLIPQLTNTIIMIPVIASSKTNWRESIINAGFGHTGETIISYKPRFLVF